MSIKRTNSQSYIQTSDVPRRTSDRYTLKDDKPILPTSSNNQIQPNNEILLKKSPKLIQTSKQKRQIAPNKLKQMRQIFTTISKSQSSKIFIFMSLTHFFFQCLSNV